MAQLPGLCHQQHPPPDGISLPRHVADAPLLVKQLQLVADHLPIQADALIFAQNTAVEKSAVKLLSYF